MSDIVYAVNNGFINYQPEVPPSRLNRGGGISMKVHRVSEAWSPYYDVLMTERFEEETCNTLVLDPLIVRYAREPEAVAEKYENHKAALKILYCSEQALLELPFERRKQLVNASSVVTSCCSFQEKQLSMMGIRTKRLCDPIPPVFLNPTIDKEVSVMGIGQISHEKNTPQMIEVFKALSEQGVKTIYMGSASLWDEASAEGLKLESELRQYSTEFYHNIPQTQVALVMRSVSAGVYLAFHETVSESNQEGCMAGIMGFYGGHALWSERPGVHNLRSTDDFVNAIATATKNFTKVPTQKHRLAAEDWALRHCSYETFINQWKEIRGAGF